MYQIGVHIGASWRIRSVGRAAAAVQQLVIFSHGNIEVVRIYRFTSNLRDLGFVFRLCRLYSWSRGVAKATV